MKVIDRGKEIDVLFIAEGTYPYIRGGVSTWIHQIITAMKDVRFGVLFLGSREEDYDTIRYNLPENLVYLESFFLFSKQEHPPPRPRRGTESVSVLKAFFRDRKRLPRELSSIEFYTEKVTFADMLYGRETWEMFEELYQELETELPFIDFFWTMKNILSPLWVLVKAVKRVVEKDIKLIHSPSTGYAGFLGALINVSWGIPLVITEHGIYTRERKIDILNSKWIKDIPSFKLDKYEIDDLRNLWINFFVNLGKVCYSRADRVFSLFEGARKTQISLGCPPEKTEVIPNGVEIERYAPLRQKRPKRIPPIVALIGRVTPIKDVKTFIKAMKILSSKLPDAQGWVIGPEDEDPEYARECRMMVRTLNLENKVKFLGFRQLEDVFPNIGITTLTSISEGMPLVVLESFASGVPCVTTDVGSCRQLIYGGLNDEDIRIGKAGEVVPVSNPRELASAYERLLTDEGLWRSCQLSGIERVEKFYSFDRFIENYRSVYEDYRGAVVGRYIHRA